MLSYVPTLGLQWLEVRLHLVALFVRVLLIYSGILPVFYFCWVLCVHVGDTAYSLDTRQGECICHDVFDVMTTSLHCVY